MAIKVFYCLIWNNVSNYIKTFYRFFISCLILEIFSLKAVNCPPYAVKAWLPLFLGEMWKIRAKWINTCAVRTNWVSREKISLREWVEVNHPCATIHISQAKFLEKNFAVVESGLNVTAAVTKYEPKTRFRLLSQISNWIKTFQTTLDCYSATSK